MDAAAEMHVRYVSAEPAPGHEFQWNLAWKHRHLCGQIYLATPWWHLRAKARRWAMWMRSIRRTHEHAQDVEMAYVSKRVSP